MRLLRLVVLGLTLAAPPLGASPAGADSALRWGPNGNGTLAHRDDTRWLDLHDAKVTANTAAGIYSARFGPTLQQMDKQPFVITGFMMPIGIDIATNRFVLTRRSASCPFCPPNEPPEAIEVFSQNFVDYTNGTVTVSGKLHLVANSERGMFYRLDAAKVW